MLEASKHIFLNAVHCGHQENALLGKYFISRWQDAAEHVQKVSK